MLKSRKDNPKTTQPATQLEEKVGECSHFLCNRMLCTPVLADNVQFTPSSQFTLQVVWPLLSSEGLHAFGNVAAL